MAEEAATQLAALAYNKKIEDADNELSAFGLSMYKKYVPEPLRAACNEYINVLEDTGQLKFLVEGANSWDYISIHYNEAFPRVKAMILDAKDWKELRRRERLVSDLRSDRREYEADVTQALVNLRTEKNVREQFPEALPYLNFTACTALVPNIDNLRNRLK